MVRPPYPAALRLLAIAQDRWAELDAANLQVDLLRLPFDRFLNAVYAHVILTLRIATTMEPSKFNELKERFDAQLTEPLEGHDSVAADPRKFTDDEAADSFAAALTTLK